MPPTGTNAVSNILSGDVIERVRALEVFSRLRVEGSRIGDSRSKLMGLSPEFVQHRQYLAGDSPRHIDWRVFGKSDRLMVKRFEEFTNTRVTIVVDTSGSMGYRGEGMSKLEYAVRCAGILFYLLFQHRDTFSLCEFNEEIATWTDNASSRRHLALIFEKLVAVKADGQTRLTECINKVESRLKGHGLLIVLSDFMDDPVAISSALGRIRVRGHDVIAFQILDPSERELDFVDFTQFRDLEDGSFIAADPLLIREEYRRCFLAHETKLKAECLARGVDHTSLEVSDLYDAMIGDYLRRRAVGVR